METKAKGKISRQEVLINAGGVELAGDLVLPADPQGVVIFVHGSGSSRHSSRNQYVARELNGTGFATLLFDLLTEQEDEVYENRFDIERLTRRLLMVTEWIRAWPETEKLAVGYFGASTGAAAALRAAAELGGRIAAVVSRGGRPDLAGDALPRVVAPTLLIVGGADWGVIELNEQALAELTCEKRLELVPGATHLFEEPGALEQVAAFAAAWFKKRLRW